MSLMSTMEILSSGLTATRLRMNLTASNLANANSTRSAEGGGPYRRRDAVYKTTDVAMHAPSFSQVLTDKYSSAVKGVKVSEVVEDTRPPRQVYDPGHPDANADGIVKFPNVNVIEEMVDMIVASRIYEAGITAMQSVKSMAPKTLTIGR